MKKYYTAYIKRASCIGIFLLSSLLADNTTPGSGVSALDLPVLPQPPASGLDQPSASLPTAPTQLIHAPQAQEQLEEKKDIFLNFENTDLTNFVNYIGELKKLNMSVDKTLQGVKVSLTIRDPLTKEGAYNIFLTVLEMAGFSLIKRGDLYTVIPRDKKLTQALPTYINVEPAALPDSDLEIRYVIFLQNIQVGDIKDLVSSMLSQPFMLIDQREVNGFIITDKAYNVKAAGKLLRELDQMGLQETVAVIKLKEANASDAKALLTSLITRPEGNVLSRLLGKVSEGSTEYFPPGTRIIAEERTNSLILLGMTKAIDKIIDFVEKYIDKALHGTKSPLHTYELKHTDAAQVAAILREVTAPPADFGPTQQAGRYGAVRGGFKYFKAMKFEVDRDGNRLIISCTDNNDWALLKKTIQDIDKPQPQVAIESLIVSVTANDIKELGGAIRNKNHGTLGYNIDFQSAARDTESSLEKNSTGNVVSLLGNMLSQLIFERGVSALSFGKPTNIWAIFSALRSLTNSTIMSQPFLTVTNKTPASIEFGETRNVLSEETSGGFSGYNEVRAATALNVTPQINLDGLIRLEIDLTIDEFTDPSGNEQESRQVKTSVTIADGQVLVLGGFIKTKVTEAKSKTPLLGDIPVLGWLFKNQRRTINKNYIFIFLSPTIIKPRSTPGMQLYTKMKLHDATDQIEDAVQTKRTKDPIHNWFFNPDGENYSHKVIDFANARYQPTTVDIVHDAYYGMTPDLLSDELDDDKKNTTSLLSQNVLIEATPAQLASAGGSSGEVQKVLSQPNPASSGDTKNNMNNSVIVSSKNSQRLSPAVNLTELTGKTDSVIAKKSASGFLKSMPHNPVAIKPDQLTEQKNDKQSGKIIEKESSLEPEGYDNIDETIAQKRKKLKELFAIPPDTKHSHRERKKQQQVERRINSLEKKRNQLKKLLSHDRRTDRHREAHHD